MIPCMINWYPLRRENRRRDAMDPAVIKETYTEQQLSEMGEDSPLFRYVRRRTICATMLSNARTDISWADSLFRSLIVVCSV